MSTPTAAELDAAAAVMQRVRDEAAAQGPSGRMLGDPWPLFIRKMRLLNPQSYGARLQNWVVRRWGWERVPSSSDVGDARDPETGTYHEIKFSLPNRSDETAHFVQIRLYQPVDTYQLFVVRPNNRLTRLVLSKEQMREEVARIGGSAHGTQAAVADNAAREHAIRIRWAADNPECVRWLRRYRADPGVPLV